LFFLAFACLSLPAGAATPPKDIQLIERADQALRDGKSRAERVDPLVELVLYNARRIGDETGASDSLLLDSVEFRRLVERYVKAVVESGFPKGKQTASARLAVLSALGTRSTAELLLSDWLGFAADHDFIENEIPSSGSIGLADQVQVRAAAGGLTVQTTGSRVVSDSGGPGSDNGVLDAGEWAKIAVQLSNESSLPWFSTSAWPESGHPCVFVPAGSEVVLSEMAPSSTASLVVSAYFSHDCPVEGPAIKIRVRDSERTRGADQEIRLLLSPTPIGRIRVTDARLDADEPGYSDGSDLASLHPDRDFELSASLSAAARMDLAKMGLGFRDLAFALFSDGGQRDVNMVALGAGRFLAGDDVDLSVQEPALYKDAFSALEGDSRWVGRNGESLIWVGVDTQLGWEISPAKAGISSIDSPSPLPRVPEEIVYDMTQKFSKLVPRPAPPQTNSGLAATDGYEIQFDREGFQEDYAAWGAAPSAPALKSAAQVAVVRTYSYRSYFPIRIYEPQAIRGCTDKLAINFLPAAEVDDGSCRFVTGCMEPAAENYDPDAVRGNDSCRYREGCMDPRAENYVLKATRSDDSCTYRKGCKDPRALNYDRKAVQSDGSCEFQQGCTDWRAFNYDRAAVKDNGSCELPPREYRRIDLSAGYTSLPLKEPYDDSRFWKYNTAEFIEVTVGFTAGGWLRRGVSIDASPLLSLETNTTAYEGQEPGHQGELGWRLTALPGVGMAWWFRPDLEAELLVRMGFGLTRIGGDLNGPDKVGTDTLSLFNTVFGADLNVTYHLSDRLGVHVSGERYRRSAASGEIDSVSRTFFASGLAVSARGGLSFFW